MKPKANLQPLRDYLAHTGIKQNQLARMIGVSVFTLNRWIKGHNTPQKYHQRLIEKELNILIDIPQ